MTARLAPARQAEQLVSLRQLNSDPRGGLAKRAFRHAWKLASGRFTQLNHCSTTCILEMQYVRTATDGGLDSHVALTDSFGYDPFAGFTFWVWDLGPQKRSSSHFTSHCARDRGFSGLANPSVRPTQTAFTHAWQGSSRLEGRLRRNIYDSFAVPARIKQGQTKLRWCGWAPVRLTTCGLISPIDGAHGLVDGTHVSCAGMFMFTMMLKEVSFFWLASLTN